MAKKNKGKDRRGVVYSTDPDFNYDYEEESVDTPNPSEQLLYIELDKKQRAGKKVTLISGFVGSEVDAKELSKDLKRLCGVGGSLKFPDILIQGDHRNKIYDYLIKEGYRVKRKGS